MKKTAKPAKRATKVVKPAVVRPKVTKVAPRKKTPPAQPQAQETPVPAPVETQPAPAPAPVEEQPPQPQVFPEIPAEGNNIAEVRDRAFADTHPANFQPPVEKTFVSPKDG